MSSDTQAKAKTHPVTVELDHEGHWWVWKDGRVICEAVDQESAYEITDALNSTESDGAKQVKGDG